VIPNTMSVTICGMRLIAADQGQDVCHGVSAKLEQERRVSGDFIGNGVRLGARRRMVARSRTIARTYGRTKTRQTRLNSPCDRRFTRSCACAGNGSHPDQDVRRVCEHWPTTESSCSPAVMLRCGQVPSFGLTMKPGRTIAIVEEKPDSIVACVGQWTSGPWHISCSRPA
jgi:hypothetical protein